ncbi:MAG: amino acid adenylation domain-containing protein [bacterium]|nr:amino acid adenylation domain-containing protein [bacterium]
MANVTERIAKLNKEQLEKFKKDLKRKGFMLDEGNNIVRLLDLSGGQIDRIPNVDKHEYYPLSNAQRRLWILHQLEDNSLTYSMPGLYILDGELNKEAFQKAYLHIINRHESLRTVFIEIDGEPQQKILENPECKVCFTDITTDLNKDLTVMELIRNEIGKSFVLSKGPLCRINIYKIEENRNYMLLNMHHIISDGWSMGIFSKEFFHSYNCFINGVFPELEDLRIQYKDYTYWKNDQLKHKDMDNHKAFWNEIFKGDIPVLNLPSDNKRPIIQSFNGKRQKISISGELLIGIKKLCKKTELSLFMMLNSVIKILLYKYSGQNDIIIGTPIAGRNHEELENQIGFYVNTIPLRDEIFIDDTFLKFAESIKKSTTSAFANQDYPFDKLIDDLDLKRDISRSPLFDILLVLQNYEKVQVEIDQLKLVPVELEEVTSKYDLSFIFFEDLKTLFCEIEYNTDIYNEDRINRMVEHLQVLISSIVKNPNSTISNLEIIPEFERLNIIETFNDTKSDYSLDKTIVDLFEDQVKKTPENIAIVFENRALSYRELNDKANNVGFYLKECLGIKPDDLVGVFLERSENLLIALLGILKSGAAYIPLDPDLPGERIKFMIEDSEPKVVISDKKNEYNVDINEILDKYKNNQNPERVSTSDNLAYVIYTSGSTGKPKGTLLTNKTVVNFIHAICKEIDFSSKKSILSITTFSFDIFVLESFIPLSAGQKIYLANKEQQTDPYALLEFLKDNKVDMIQSTPSRLKQLCLEDDFISVLSGFSEIIVGGEAFPEDLLRILNDNCNGKIYNMYGPTETTVWSTLALLNQEKSIHIGKPVANTQIYILDKNKKIVPIGIPGELHISGDCLSVGYMNRPELTKEKFTRNSIYPGKKMYCTGDLAFWRPDGNIEFLGRIDNQVKIRGYRIELEEIEKVINKYNGIVSSFVTDVECQSNEKEILAYYISEYKVEAKEIKDFLRIYLPEYMIPNNIFRLDEFPLTVNGKIDKNLLPNSKSNNNINKSDLIEPGTNLEKSIISIWKEVLCSDSISIRDNFFDIGGNSLKMMHVAKKLKDNLGYTIPIYTLYQYPNIESLSCYLGNKEQRKYDQSNKSVNSKSKKTEKKSEDIAVIGLSGRFPGAGNIDEFWDNLKNGKESVTRFSDKELLEIGITQDLLDNPDFIKSGAFIDDKECFDAGFFGYSPMDAEFMDPQIRLFHEISWSVLEDAGYNPEKFDGLIGVYAGSSINQEWLLKSSLAGKEYNPFELSQLVDINFLSTRISYKLDLKGPSYFINTACSTSLATIIIACNDILSGNCDMALAGGVRIVSDRCGGYLHQDGMVLSDDGHCRPYDSNASGFVGGEGGGAVLLKRLDQAIDDNDNIYAVIKGYGTNNDGARKVGYTAPSIEGQSELIKKVQRFSNVSPDNISFIEGHGTGTKMGDPIEVEALKQAFNSNNKSYCALGSVKANIGHLDSAAGIASFIKTVLSVKNKQIPPSINVDDVNPLLNLDDSPFYINRELKEWRNKNKLRAGISSFGIGGTNAHLIVEEPPLATVEYETGKINLITLSATSKDSLLKQIDNLSAFLDKNCNINIPDLSYTLTTGRKHFSHRYSISGFDRNEIIAKLEDKSVFKTNYNQYRYDSYSGKTVFMYPGQGSQFINMGIGLYNYEEKFRAEVDNCLNIINKIYNIDLKKYMFPENGNIPEKSDESQVSSTILFIIEYALTKLLYHKGVKPDYLIGHSLGEYTAACISGILSLEDALILIFERGKLVNSIPEGSMLSILISKNELLEYLDGSISFAVENGDQIQVVSGKKENINAFKLKMEGLGYSAKMIKTDYGYHSYLLDPVLDEFRGILRKIKLNKPQIPYISNVSAQWITGEEVTDTEYWVRHLRGTVLFHSSIEKLLEIENLTLIEVGPGSALNSIVKNCNIQNLHLMNLVNYRKKQDRKEEYTYFYNQLSALYLTSDNLDWDIYWRSENRRKISLPTYPFEKKYFGKIFDYTLKDIELFSKFNSSSVSEAKTYARTWKEELISKVNTPLNSKYLIFNDDLGITEKIESMLKEEAQFIISVDKGEKYERISKYHFIINSTNKEDYEKLFLELEKEGFIPEKVIHGFNFSNYNEGKISLDEIDRTLDENFFGIFYLVKALESRVFGKKIELSFISSNSEKVLGIEDINPVKATIISIIKNISREYPEIECRNIDIFEYDFKNNSNVLVKNIIDEISGNLTDQHVAYRFNKRWIPTFSSIELNESSSNIKLKNKGVYFVPGGFGGLGQTFARYLTSEFDAKVILSGRTSLPPREEWNKYLEKSDNDKLHAIIRGLIEIEEAGGELLLIQADVSDYSGMEKAVSQIEKEFGYIDGIIYTAGIADGRLIKLRDKEDINEVLRSKVHGSLIIKEIFKDKNLDFVLFCSSISSLLGEVGQFAYSAANQFLDNLVYHFNPEINTYSINWCGWKEVGMLANSKTLNQEIKDSNSISPENGLKILKKVLSTSYSNVIVSTIDIDTINEISESTDFTILDTGNDINSTRPELPNEYLAATTDMEEQLVYIWQSILGIDQIGITDNFYELGGHSLKAISLISAIKSQLNIEIQLSDIFENLTIKELAVVISQTSIADNNPVKTVKENEYYPLSSSQLRIYLQSQRDIKSTAYNMFNVLKIDGIIDKHKINRIFKELVKRHESLRTYFIMEHGEIVQKIFDEVDFDIAYEKIQDNENIKDKLNDFLQPFDLSYAPLLRIILLEISLDLHYLVYDMHHIIADGISQNILMKEFLSKYQGSSIDPLNFQYKDFTGWESENQASDKYENQKKYWKGTFNSSVPLIDLPLDRGRGEIIDFKGSAISFSIDKKTSSLILDFANKNNITLNVFFFSAYTIFLNIICKQNEIVVGTISGNRNRSEWENIIGIFTNYLAVYNKINIDESVNTFLQNTQKKLIEVYDNCEYPYNEIINDLQYPIPENRNPLFDTIFLYHNEIETLENLHLDNIYFSSYNAIKKSSSVDLKLDIYNDIHEGFNCIFEYRTGILNEESINEFIKYFNRLIPILLKSSDTKIKDINLLTRNESMLLSNKRENKVKIVLSSTFTTEPVIEFIDFWCNHFNINTEIAISPYNQVFQQLLDHKSLLNEDQSINIILIRFEDWLRDDTTSISEKIAKLKRNYNELLNILESRIHLTFLGMFPVKEYLGIDDEVREIINQMYSSLELDIKHIKNLNTVDFQNLKNIFSINQIFDPVQDKEGHIPFSNEFYSAMGTTIARKINSINNTFKVIAVDCDNTLWKGICGEDGALGISINKHYKEFQLFILDCYRKGFLIALVSRNNESDVWDVFDKNPDMIIKRSHIVESEINWNNKSVNLKNLAKELNLGIDSIIFIDDSVNECSEVMMNAPEVLTLQLPDKESDRIDYLKCCWAFDQLKITEEDQRRTSMYIAENKRKEIREHSISLDSYISELDLKVSITLLKEEEITRASQMTIRTNQFNLNSIRRSESEIRDLFNSNSFQCWIIKASDRFGDYGISGFVVLEELKNQLFIDTFLLSCRILGRSIEKSVLKGIIKYCTSHNIDNVRAKYIESGKNNPFRQFLDSDLWVLDSKDDKSAFYQLKIDPIENSSIELFFMKDFNSSNKNENHIIMPEITESQSKNTFSETYNSWKMNIINDENLLYKNHITILNNRTADSILSLIKRKEVNSCLGFDKPENDIEVLLEKMYLDILKVQKAGRNNSFFDLGGNSLHAVQLVSRISREIGVEVTISVIFDNPKVSELSTIISQSSFRNHKIIEKAKEKDFYDLTNAQRRLWILNQVEADSLAYNMPATYSVEGKYKRESFEKALDLLIERHESLRTIFISINNKPMQKILTSINNPIEYYDVKDSSDSDTEALEIIKKLLEKSFNLSTGPLVKIAVISISDSKFVIFLNMHHIISDGWSLNIFYKELMTLYNCVKENKVSCLEPLRIQYKDYSQWFNSRLKEDSLRREKSYWMSKLSGDIKPLNLPLDKKRPLIQTYNGNSCNFYIEPNKTLILQTLCKELNVSLFMILQLLVKVLLFIYSNQEDIIIGSSISGRSSDDLSNQIGLFVNTVVFRDFINGNKTFTELLIDIRKTSLEAYANQNYPFDYIVEDLGIKRDMGRSPIFDVWLVLNNNNHVITDIGEVTISRFDFDNKTCKFDLMFEFTEFEDQIFTRIEYNTDLFYDSTISFMKERFELILANFTEAPDTKISKIDLDRETELPELDFFDDDLIGMSP